jgi:hypothetical protein
MSQSLPQYRVGDTQRDLLCTVTYVIEGATTPTARDLTGVSSVKFSMVNAATGVTKIDEASATIDDAGTGKVSYSWTSSDVDTAGKFWAFFTVYTSTVTDTFPVKRDDLIVLFGDDTQTPQEAYQAALTA